MRRLSPLQWRLLSFFLAVGVVGAGGAVWSWMTPTHADPLPKVAAHSSSFASESAPEASDESTPALTWAEWFSYKGVRLGFGFVGGFVFGFIFRIFVKITAAVVGAVILLLGALSYLNILNVDLSAAETAVQTNAEWLTTQAWHLKSAVVEHLPSTTSAAAGVFVGMRRR